MLMCWKIQSHSRSQLSPRSSINSMQSLSKSQLDIFYRNQHVEFKICREIQRTWNWQNNFEKEQTQGVHTS